MNMEANQSDFESFFMYEEGFSIAKIWLLLLHLITVSIILFILVTIYKGIDIEHPVFTLAFQVIKIYIQRPIKMHTKSITFTFLFKRKLLFCAPGKLFFVWLLCLWQKVPFLLG